MDSTVISSMSCGDGLMRATSSCGHRQTRHTEIMNIEGSDVVSHEIPVLLYQHPVDDRIIPCYLCQPTNKQNQRSQESGDNTSTRRTGWKHTLHGTPAPTDEQAIRNSNFDQ